MIKRIVLTGGPSSGKTTVLERIQKVYPSLGYKVIVVEETATYLIEKGIKAFGDDDYIDLIDFQELVMRMQLAKESVIDRAVEMMPEQDIIIIYDRGAIDNSAYVSEEEFKTVLNRLNGTKNFYELMNKYDLIINLVGSKEFYTLENNKARSESVDEALKLGEKTLRSWYGHPKIKIVLPKKEKEDKIKEVLNIINSSLQMNEVKRQEKYLVDLTQSNLEYIKESGRLSRITQDYLMSPTNIEKRLRKIEMNDSTTYYLSVYKILENGTKIMITDKEIESSIYETLLEFKEENSVSIEKIRYYFSYNGKYFYLDIFDDNEELGLLEINVEENEIVEIPDFLKVIERVTNNEKYYNRNIATNNNNQLKLKL